MSAPWPLVGRDDELRFLLGALDDDGTRGVILVGDPGVGKTRLAQEAAELVRSSGHQPITVIATPATAEIPLGALVPWLPAEAIAHADRTRALASGCAALAAHADGGPLLLCIDDAHLLDPLSAALVHRAVVSGPVTLLATMRRAASAPDDITSLWKDGIVERLEVTGLSRHEHDELVHSVLGDTVHGSALERLWRVTLGNVLFLRVVIDTARAAGDLQRHDGVWALTGSLEPGPALVDLVGIRLGSLTAAVERVIEYVAFSEPVALDTVLALTSTGAIDRAERSGTIVAVGEGDGTLLRLAHPMYGEVLRSRTPLLRSRSIMRDLAETVERRGLGYADETIALATWRLAIGDDCPIDVLLDASRHARGRFDFQLAERFATAAVAKHGGAVASIARAECLFLASRCADAETEFAGIDVDGFADRTRADVAVARATNLMFGLGDFGAADRLLDTTTKEVADPTVASHVRAMQGRFALAAGALNHALALTGAVASDPDAEPATRIAAGVARAPALAIAGRTAAALDLTDRLPFTLERLADFPVEANTMALCRISAHWFAGDLDAAAREAAALYESGVRLGYWEAVCDGARARASIALACGMPRTSIRWARESLASIPDGDRADIACWCRAVLTEALAVAGDPSAVVEARSMHTGHRAMRIFDAQVARADAWAAVASGEVTRAVEILEDGAAAARSDGALAAECFLLHDVVRLDRPERVAARLDELTELVDGRWPDAFHRHAVALTTRDPDALAQVATTFVGIGAALLAAEAEMQAARAHRARGAERGRRAATSRAVALAAGCEGACTPALSTPESVVPLTRRELEIAALAGRGLASPEIARRLTVSTRTIEGHLHRMYVKLGVSRREDLGRHIRR